MFQCGYVELQLAVWAGRTACAHRQVSQAQNGAGMGRVVIVDGKMMSWQRWYAPAGRLFGMLPGWGRAASDRYPLPPLRLSLVPCNQQFKLKCLLRSPCPICEYLSRTAGTELSTLPDLQRTLQRLDLLSETLLASGQCSGRTLILNSVQRFNSVVQNKGCSLLQSPVAQPIYALLGWAQRSQVLVVIAPYADALGVLGLRCARVRQYVAE